MGWSFHGPRCGIYPAMTHPNRSGTPVTYKLHPGFWSWQDLWWNTGWNPQTCSLDSLKDWKKRREIIGKSTKKQPPLGFFSVSIMISLIQVTNLTFCRMLLTSIANLDLCRDVQQTRAIECLPNKKTRVKQFQALEKSWYAFFRHGMHFFVGEYIDVFSTEISYPIGSILNGTCTYMNGWFLW